MASSADSKTKLFISYSRKDKLRVDQLHDALSGDDELDVFLDTHDIAAAEEWRSRLEDLIRSADTILFALSPNSIASEICQWELELAERLNKRIVPIVVKPVADKNVPPELSKLNYIFFRKKSEFQPALESIGQALKIDIDWIREHTRLADMAYRWDRANKLGAQPLRGKELEAAEQWLASQPKQAPSPTVIQRRYIYESRKTATKRQRIMVTGSIAAVLIVGVLSIFAWVQRNAAVEGERKAEAALSNAIDTANSLTIDIAKEFQDATVPASTIKKILDKSLELNKKLSQDFDDDEPLKRSELIATDLLASKYVQDGLPEKAISFAKKAVYIAEQLYEKKPSLENENNLANSLDTSHEVHVLMSGYGNHNDLVERAYFHSKNVMAQKYIQRYRENFATIAANLGRAQYQSGQPAKALAFYKEAITALDGIDSTSRYASFQKMSILERWGTQLQNGQSKIDKFEEAMKIVRKLLDEYPENTRYLYAKGVLHRKLGLVQLNLDQAVSGAKMMFESYLISGKLLSLDPSDERRRNLVIASSYMGDAMRAAGTDLEDSMGSAANYYQKAFVEMKILSATRKNSVQLASEYVTIVRDYINHGAETRGYQLGGIFDLMDYVFSLSALKMLDDYHDIIAEGNQLKTNQEGIKLFDLLQNTVGRLAKY